MTSHEPGLTELCPKCSNWHGDLLPYGHDHLGHRVANMLYQNGYRSYEDVRLANDEILVHIRNLGPKGIERVHEVIRQAADQREGSGSSG